MIREAFGAAPPTWRISRTTALVTATAAAGVLVLASTSRESLPLVQPLVCILAIAALVAVHLYAIDRELPVFDLGALTVFATALYSAIPLAGFWLAGLTWTPLSYLPLWVYKPGPTEVGAFAWRHVVYLACFSASYVAFRGRATLDRGMMRDLRPSAVAAIGVLLVALLAYFKMLEFVSGVSYDPSYSDLGIVSAGAEALPLVVRQVSHNLFAILVLLKIALLIWLVRRWESPRWRLALFVWLAAEGVLTVFRMGARSAYATLLVAAVLLYHRLVRPVRPMRALLLAIVLLSGALAYGLARDVGGGIRTIAAAEDSPWATMNEFQALYGISYDLKMRKDAGTLGVIPWQIYAADAIRLIPSQFLPFEKADPCVGYPLVDGVGVGCVLGVISNAILGLDWIELVIRGLVLGLLFAMLYRWYVAHQTGYWATMFYLCMCLWSYYTFRGSSFYFAYQIAYRLVPMLIAVRLMQILLRNVRRAIALSSV